MDLSGVYKHADPIFGPITATLQPDGHYLLDYDSDPLNAQPRQYRGVHLEASSLANAVKTGYWTRLWPLAMQYPQGI